ncbi:hypothetical protein [Marinobacterium stanieri]|uniref:Uncharacterized protein n=1 Tax=Marinobacterium stanieri TaxID=49186 RepID=A0A1N6XGV2_9GAMM|nr:hypothetical protein [Marinobacterium stanieri]SIR01461.1 hypothetical protein SAMN05421647_11416 [Marinobacterium stanieri]
MLSKGKEDPEYIDILIKMAKQDTRSKPVFDAAKEYLTIGTRQRELEIKYNVQQCAISSKVTRLRELDVLVKAAVSVLNTPEET